MSPVKMQIDHNKIINEAAKNVLKSNGLFRKGSSRTWIDDNGWFLIIVEFQPSNWDRGSYLNVAVHYLWAGQDHISFDYGGREKEFVAFADNTEQFYKDMTDFAYKALEKVQEYRNFQNLEWAKERILSKRVTSSIGATSVIRYHQMMICGLSGDVMARKFYEELKEETRDSELVYDIKFREELNEKIAPIIHDSAAFQDYIKSKVLKQREFWHSKSSMKQLRVGQSLQLRD